MPSWGCAATGSLISCARAASAGSTATHFIENNARYVEYCGAGECVGLYYTCINSYLTPESPAWGRCRPRYSAESRTEFAEDFSPEARWIRTIGSATEKLRSVRAPRVDMRAMVGTALYHRFRERCALQAR